jgi:hypothetical protein
MSFYCFPNITFRLFKSSTGRDAAGQIRDIRRPVALSLLKNDRVRDAYCFFSNPAAF